MHIGAYIILIGDKNIFDNYGQRRREQHNQIPALHVKVLKTYASGDRPFSWDTDRISFVIDNSSTSIIRNERRLFTKQFKPMSVTLETAEGLTNMIKLVGTLSRVLTDDSNENHVYKIPQCIYDHNIPLNIIGVPDLGKFFGDNADAHIPLA